MADKEIYFDDVRVGWGTKASMKEEISTEETPTFDGKLVDNDPNPSVTVSIETVRAGTVREYINLRKKVKYAKDNPITIQIVGVDQGKDGKIVEKNFAYNCKLSNDEFEFDPAKRTASKLEFKGESSREIINGEEI